jgi:hypothetical protein
VLRVVLSGRVLHRLVVSPGAGSFNFHSVRAIAWCF